jgi:hypothetical protein
MLAADILLARPAKPAAGTPSTASNAGRLNRLLSDDQVAGAEVEFFSTRAVC